MNERLTEIAVEMRKLLLGVPRTPWVVSPWHKNESRDFRGTAAIEAKTILDDELRPANNYSIELGMAAYGRAAVVR